MRQTHKILPRILISLLGAAMILMGISGILLGFFGESAPGVITNIRREGGERADAVPGRYTYNISYTFTLPDGREIDGMTKRIGSAVYVKADGTSAVRIRYFPFFPYLSAIEHDTGLRGEQLVLILAGSLLIYLMNRGTNKQRIRPSAPRPPF